ncbi:MAG: hypothetical protein Fur005_28790 [Roseiflexaceae bacterium]
MVTLRRHSHYRLPDGTRVMARCWETGIAPPQWKLHTADERSQPLYLVVGECLHRYTWDEQQRELVPIFCDLVLDDLAAE